MAFAPCLLTKKYVSVRHGPRIRTAVARWSHWSAHQDVRMVKLILPAGRLGVSWHPRLVHNDGRATARGCGRTDNRAPQRADGQMKEVADVGRAAHPDSGR
jgi:hypothetical protein